VGKSGGLALSTGGKRGRLTRREGEVEKEAFTKSEAPYFLPKREKEEGRKKGHAHKIGPGRKQHGLFCARREEKEGKTGLKALPRERKGSKT